MVVVELPARFKEFKSKSDAAAKKLDKIKAFQAAQRRVDELRSQLDTDENDDKDPAVKTCDPEDSRSRTLEVMPRIEFESRVEETASVKAAFHDDVKLVTTALFLSGEQVCQLEAEHLDWASYLLDAQYQIVKGSTNVLKLVLDLHKCCTFRVNAPQIQTAFPMHTRLLDISAPGGLCRARAWLFVHERNQD